MKKSNLVLAGIFTLFAVASLTGSIHATSLKVAYSTCPPPTQLTAQNISSYEATLGWTQSGEADSWNVEYGLAGFTAGSGTFLENLDNNAYFLDGLLHGTAYSFYVQADCGGGELSEWAGPYTFSTLCTPILTPFFEGFEEGYTHNTNVGRCWTQHWFVNTRWRVNSLFTDHNRKPRTGSFNAFLQPYSVSWMIHPLEVAAGTVYVFEIYARSNFGQPKMTIAWGNTGTVSAMTNIIIPETSVSGGDYQLFTASFMTANSGTIYLGIKGESQGHYISIDDIHVFAVACPKPYDLYAINIGPYQADIGWTQPGTANLWNIEWGPAGFEKGMGTVIAGTGDNPYSLTALESGTFYDFYVQADCGEDGLGEWAGPYTFMTECLPAEIPFFEGFENGYTHNTPVDRCWTQASVTGNQQWLINGQFTSNNRTPRTGSFNATLVHSNTTWLFYPVELSAGLLYDFEMYARQSSNNPDAASISVAFGPAGNATAMTTVVVEQTALVAGGYQQLTGNILAGETGTYYIGILGSISNLAWHISIDDIHISGGAACHDPKDLIVSDVSPSGAEINWTQTGAAVAWNIEWGHAGFEQGQGNLIEDVSVKPYPFDGLDTGTSYDVYIQAICNNNELSAWAGPVGFTTAFATPFSENFDTTPLNQVPPGWTRETNTVAWRVSNQVGGSSEPNAIFTFYNTTAAKDDWFFTPPIALTEGVSYDISFAVRAPGWGGVGEKLAVKWGNEPGAASMTGGTIYENQNIQFPGFVNILESFIAPASGIYYFGWHAFSAADINYIAVDDIDIRETPGIDLALTAFLQSSGLNPPKINGLFGHQDRHARINETDGEPVLTLPAESYGETESSENNTLFLEGINNKGGITIPDIEVTSTVENLAQTASGYILEWDVDGVSQIPVAGSVLAPGASETMNINFSPAQRGTFFTNGFINVANDENLANNSARFRMRIYPDVFDRTIYDRGDNNADTWIGWGPPGNLKNISAVRFTAVDFIQLVGVDFLVRSETVTAGTFIINVRAQGNSTQAPGAVIYTKEFTNPAYFSDTGDMMHFAFDDDLPVIYPGSDYWITIEAPAGTTFPSAAHNNGFSPGRSFYFAHALSTWVPLVIDTERAWVLRSVHVEVDAPTTPLLSVQPSETDFGNIQVGSESSLQLFTIRNVGPGDLVVQTPSVGDDGNFSLIFDEAAFPATLSGLETREFNAVFHPLVAGQLSTTVSIAHEDGKGVATVELRGTGVARPAGSNCLSPLIVTLPLENYQDNTEAYGNDYQPSWIEPENEYLGGNDFVARFTLTEASVLTASVIGNWAGLFILGDCPDPESPPAPLGFAGSSTGGTITNLLLPPGTYYAIVSSSASTPVTGFQLNLSALELACEKPADLNAGNITTSAADLSWSAVPHSIAWDIEYGLHGFSQNSGTLVIEIPDNHYTITNLLQAARYDFYVRSRCTLELLSEWTGPYTFDTACEAFGIPFAQFFNTNQFPVCWSQSYSGGITGERWVLSNSSQAGGSAYEALTVRSDQSGVSRLVSPPIDLSSATNPILQFKHNYRDLGQGCIFKVQSSNDGINWTDEGFSFTSGSGNIGPQTVNIPVTGGSETTYISWVVEGNHNQFLRWHIDDVIIQEVACPMPYQLAAGSITDSSAELSWQQWGEAASWFIEYGPPGFTQGSGTLITGITGTTYTLENLEQNTQYQFIVRANCGGGQISEWSLPFAFNTICLPYDIPLFENFDVGPIYLMHECWNRSGFGSWRASPSGQGYSLPRSLRLFHGINSFAIVALPHTNAGINQLKLSFQANANTGSGVSTANLYAGTMSDPSDANTFTSYQHIEVTSAHGQSWQHLTVYFDEYAGDDQYIALRLGHPDIDAEELILIDDVLLDFIPGCPSPHNIAITDISTTGAHLSWLQFGQADSWNFAWGHEGYTDNEETIITGLANATYYLTDLEPQTRYEVRVQAVCSDGNTGNWSLKKIVKTMAEGDNCVNAIDLSMISPPYNGSTINAENSFAFCNMEQSNDLIFYHDVDPGATITIWKSYNSYDSRHTMRWGGDCPGIYQIDCINTPHYKPISWINTNQTTQRVWFIVGGQHGQQGNFTLEWHYATCSQPVDLHASNITVNSALLSWTDHANAQTWELEYGMAGFVPGEGMLITNITEEFYALSDLQHSSKYHFYVRGNCGNGDLSKWSGPFEFITTCGIASVPLIVNFDDNDDVLPLCWTFSGFGNNYTGEVYTLNQYVSPPNSFRIAQDASFTMLSSPELSSSLTELRIRFRAIATEGCNRLHIGSLSDPEDMDDFIPFQEIVLDYTWQEFEVYFDGYQGNNTRITLAYGNFDDPGEVFIDDIIIQLIGACPEPYNLTAGNIASGGADLLWLQWGAHDNWNIEIGEHGFEQGTGTLIEGITGQPFRVSGLAPSTDHAFYVQTVCDATYSSWSGPAVFTTADLLTVIANAMPQSVCVDSLTQLLAEADGGSGVYTYQWTSDPPGFYSDQPDPIVGPDTGTTYHVSVSDGYETATAAVDVILYQAVQPGQVVNMLPADHTVINMPQITLSWQPAVNANTYDVYIWPIDEADPAEPVAADLTGIQYTHDALNYATTYKWKVVAKNPCLETESVIRHFSVTELPDLIVSNIDAPANPSTLQQIEISWTVFNQGNAGTLGHSWFDAVYLSLETFPSPDTDIYLGAVENLTPLPAGTGYTRSFNVTLPANTIGEWYIHVRTDNTNFVPEMDESNNMWYEPVLISLTPPPDLQVTQIITPGITFSGNKITVQWTTINSGPGSVFGKRWVDRIYLSQAPEFDRSASVVLGQRSFNHHLLPGESYTGSSQVTLPNYISGDYYIYVYTDADNNVFEHANEDNNILRSNMFEIILSPPADLLVTSVEHPVSLSNNEPFTVTWSVYNQGAEKTKSRGWTDEVYLSPDAAFDPGSAIQLGSVFYFAGIDYSPGYAGLPPVDHALLPGTGYTRSRNLTTPQNIAGEYYIFVYTDVLNNEFEFNIENNLYMSATPITINHADLMATEPVIADSVHAGQHVIASWKVTNNGPGNVINSTITDKIYLSQHNTLPIVNPVEIGSLTYKNTILQGQTLQKSRTVSIPEGLSGNYYVFFNVNADNMLFENDLLDNNIVVDSIFVHAGLYPDLLISNALFPAEIIPGLSLEMQFEVTNAGDANVFGKQWQDAIYISDSEVFDKQSAVKLWSATVNQPLNIDETYVTNATFLVPFAGFADYEQLYLHCLTNGNNSFYEMNFLNNLASSQPIPVTLPPKVDLLVSSASTPVHTTKSGQRVDFSYTVTNNSTSTGVWGITEWQDALYLSDDPHWSETDLLLSAWDVNLTLPTGASYSRNLNITVPHGLAGDYYFIVVTDHNKDNEDLDYSNNYMSITGITPIYIEPTPYPDLHVEMFESPVTAIAGQPVKFRWQVSNIGEGPVTVPSWIDRIYLSSDFIVNPGDIRLATKHINKVLDVNESYIDSVEVNIPPNIYGNFIVIFETDAQNVIFETGQGTENNFAYEGIYITQAPPSDLIVEDITFESPAGSGSLATINYTLRNIGENPARGSLTDMVYLSADSIWHFDDPWMAKHRHVVFIAPAMSRNVQVTANVPGLIPGDYKVIVITNVLQNINENNYANNTGISEDDLGINMPELLLGIEHTGHLTNNIPNYFQVSIPAEFDQETMMVSIEGEHSNAANELYLSHESIPTRSMHDYAATVPFEANQDLVVPGLSTGTYYLLVNGNSAAGHTQNVSLVAKIIPFGIHAVDASKGGNTGDVTVLLKGAKFETDMQLMLTNSDDVAYHGEIIMFINSTRLFATFNLKDAITGVYDVVAVKNGGEQAVLSEGFEITESTSGNISFEESGFSCEIESISFFDQLGTDLDFPAMVRPNRIAVISIHFANNGSIDIPTPQRLLISLSGSPLSFDLTDFSENIQQVAFEFTEHGGPPGLLRPGAQGTVTIYTRSSVTGNMQFVLTR